LYEVRLTGQDNRQEKGQEKARIVCPVLCLRRKSPCSTGISGYAGFTRPRRLSYTSYRAACQAEPSRLIAGLKTPSQAVLFRLTSRAFRVLFSFFVRLRLTNRLLRRGCPKGSYWEPCTQYEQGHPIVYPRQFPMNKKFLRFSLTLQKF
jgi:hypothetical protein